MLNASTTALFTLTARSSFVQSGQATRVQVVTLSAGGGAEHVPTRISATTAVAPGFALPAQEVKSEATLLREQVDKVLEQLQTGLDGAGDSLRESWRGAVERGEIAAEAEASFADMGKLAAQDPDLLPEDLRTMVEAFGQAQDSMASLRAQAAVLLEDAQQREASTALADFKQALIRAVDDIATAQLLDEAGGHGATVDNGARNALMLIRAARASQDREGGAVPSDDDAMGQRVKQAMQDARALQLQKRHREIADGIWEMIDNGDLQVSGSSATYWGTPDVALEVAGGHAAVSYASQIDVLTEVSVSASLSSGRLSLIT